MRTATESTTTTRPSVEAHFPRPATTGMPATRRNQQRLHLGLVGIAAGAGMLTALASRRSGLYVGGVAALALGALRVQMARWFTPTPAYAVEDRLGVLELRRYSRRIEARTALEVPDFESALARGYGRLAVYVYGENSRREDIERTTPILMAMRDGTYEAAFVMPPDRPVAELPEPSDVRVHLREVPEQRVAVLAFHGRFTREHVERHERELSRALVDAGLAARGSATFACYDSPATLPFLRRNELWIEIA